MVEGTNSTLYLPILWKIEPPVLFDPCILLKNRLDEEHLNGKIDWFPIWDRQVWHK